MEMKIAGHKLKIQTVVGRTGPVRRIEGSQGTHSLNKIISRVILTGTESKINGSQFLKTTTGIMKE
jgi:hypothetical protein